MGVRERGHEPELAAHAVASVLGRGRHGHVRCRAAIGSPSPTVQWQVKPPAGAFADIGGATSSTLVLRAVTMADNGNQYRAVFTNSVGSATTNPATLTVTAAPTPPLGDTAWITSFTPSSLRNDFSGWVGARLVVGPADVSVTALIYTVAS